MKYTLKGKLYTAICDDQKKPLPYTKIRIYRYDAEINEATAFTAAQSKEISLVYEEKEIKARKKLLLAETTTNAQGGFEVEIDGKKTGYDGGIVEIVAFYDSVPNYGQEGDELPRRFKPFEVRLDIIQPKWRETDLGLVASWRYCLLRRIWCYILRRLDIWLICGRLTNCESKEPLIGVEVIAMDDDVITDDLLGSAITDANGKFCIAYRSKDFKKTFLSPFINIETPIFPLGNGPDVYFKFAIGGSVFDEESPSASQQPSRKNVGNCLCVNLCLKETPDHDGVDPPAAFYNIGYARKYHPVLNIDPATGRTTGKVPASWNEQAFFGNLDLRGSLSEELNGNTQEYKFQYFKVPVPNFDISTIAETDWNDVTAAQMAKNTIATRITQLFPVIKYDAYVIKGTDGPTTYGNEVAVTMNGNWIQVPQYSGLGFDIFFNGSLIKLASSTLAGGTVDKSALIQGNTSAPLEKNRYFALRMLKRELGNPATQVPAGFSRPIAIFNTIYQNVPQGGTWLPTSQNELGIASVDLQELISGGGCAKITTSLTVKYTAANPNLGNVSINMYGPGGPHNFEPVTFPSPGEEAFGTSLYTGADNVVDPNDVSNLPKCAYEIRLSAELNLTDGEDQHHNIWDRVLFCK